MGKPTRSAAELNAVLTSYAEAYLNRKLTNQGFTVHPVLDHLLDTKAYVPGGNEIIVPILDGYTPAGDSFGRGSDIDYSYTDHATQARYNWAFVREPVTIDYVDEQKATGDGAMLRFVEDALDAAYLRMQEQLAGFLCAASTGTAPDGSADLASLLPLIDSTGAIGGLNPATAGQTFWAAYENSSVGSFASGGPAALRTAWRTVSKYKMLGQPTRIFASATAIDAYEVSGLALQTQMRGDAATTADIGVTGLNYRGVPIVYEPHLDALEGSLNGVMLGVNDQAVKLVVKPGEALKVMPFFDARPAGKMARCADIVFCGQTICVARAPLFKLAGITA